MEGQLGLELCKEFVKPLLQFLSSGRFGTRALGGLGIFRFPGITRRFLCLQFLFERCDPGDFSILLGQLSLDFMECGSVLRIPFTELHFEPMDSALRRLQLLDSRMKAIGVGLVMFQSRQALMQGEQFLFLERECLLRSFECGLGFPDFLCLRPQGLFVLADLCEEARLSRFQCEHTLRCSSHLVLQRMDASVARGEFLLSGLVERLRCTDLAFEDLDCRGFDVQFVLKLFQRLLFGAQDLGDVTQVLSERAGGLVSQQPSDCAADSRRDEETSQHLADEHGHRSPTPFTRNSMRRLCWKPARVCATDRGREAP